VGCSQSFYEYALERAQLPIQWVLADLQNNLIQPSQTVRRFLIQQLSISGPTETASHELEPADVKRALTYLTPAETQSVLLSRFVLAPLTPQLLNDDYLDLLWEARGRVSEDTRQRWTTEVTQFLSSKHRHELKEKHWRWVTVSWEQSPQFLEAFAPQILSNAEFPWTEYLEALHFHRQDALLLTCLHRVPDERLRIHWIEVYLNQTDDRKLLMAIQGLTTEHVRHHWQAEWWQRRDDRAKVLMHRQLEFETTPILNDQIRIARDMIHLLGKVRIEPRERLVSEVMKISRFLETNGGLDADLCDELSRVLDIHHETHHAWRFMLQRWVRSPRTKQADILPLIVDLGQRAGAVSETQKFLVDEVFQSSAPDSLAVAMLNHLMEPEGPFRVKHLRGEFVERTSELFPLHRELLKARAAHDYRALLLWECFYGELLEHRAAPMRTNGKRIYELWTLTNSVSRTDLFLPLVSLLEMHDAGPQSSTIEHEYRGKAERLMIKLGKSYGLRKIPKLVLSSSPVPFRLYFKNATLEMNHEFFEMIDEETWTALCVGAFQAMDDRDKGLFDTKRLIERFFQALLISGAPIAKVIRLCVWIGIHYRMTEPKLAQQSPEDLLTRLPFLGAVVGFYLSRDFSEKSDRCALNLN
jgi:hypothetical protein